MPIRISLFFLFLLIGISSTLSQTPQKTAIAAEGDGIYSILRKNGLDPVKYFKLFITLNKEYIKSDNGLFIGRIYSLPSDTMINSIEIEKASLVDSVFVKPIDNIPSIEKIEYPLFGKDYASVTIENKKLEGAIYYLISGHGGPDPGATEKHKGKLISEDEYAYDVTLRLARKLISNGAKVYIIIKDPNDGIRNQRILEIDYDEVNHPNKKIPRSQKLRLKQRTQAVNNLFLKHKGTYQRLIVTHVDSRSKGENIDVFFYHHKNSKNGLRLAKNIHNAFKQKYAQHQPNRKYSGTVSSRSNLYLIKNTLPAMVYIELGNIKSEKDQKRILNYENREALAKWIFNGLLVDFELRNQ